jgi:hypothetical protein
MLRASDTRGTSLTVDKAQILRVGALVMAPRPSLRDYLDVSDCELRLSGG